MIFDLGDHVNEDLKNIWFASLKYNAEAQPSALYFKKPNLSVFKSLVTDPLSKKVDKIKTSHDDEIHRWAWYFERNMKMTIISSNG